MFQFSVEMTSVIRNGSWVTTIAKIRAGSSGARCPARRARATAPAGSAALVLVGCRLGQLLAVLQRRADVPVTRDRRADVLGDLRRDVGELRDGDVLNAHRRSWLHAWVRRVDA